MTLLKDLINIPERVHQGDFVLKLSEGLAHADATLRDYVVTPQLVDSFDNALGFIKQAISSSSSKAAYLHGSFGAGKSHFMAVLNLILAGNTQARARIELADVVARHNWTHGKKFLLIPYHMIDSRDMESAILGQYAEYVRRLHPHAPVPGFYLAEGLFEDAKRMRETIGDAAFFERLNQAPRDNDNPNGWGNVDGDGGWDASSLDAAMQEAPNGEERARLVGDLISQFFSAYRSMAGGGESFVSLDDGLSIMTRHAEKLGYDAVILFLDELILWLASHAADPGFVSREGTKLVKLVEATNAERPIPLVSFVARQRDLRDLVGENLAGSVQAQFSDVLRHWEARFHRIMLDDRNLPAIAQQRVLRPQNEAARQTLHAAFDDILRLRKDVLDTLLTTSADREMFRQVYPFSPALVETLIAVSAALQRERTALKLMMQMLVDRRADLELGQLIPVGDLYDAICEGDEPFSEGMRLHFENAKRLYAQRLLPMLERQHKVTLEAIKLGQADALAAKNLRNDARIIKTLLLGALVPEVQALKNLTGARLAALNHGTFKSPIPGREDADVVRKCRDWASQIGEIKISEDERPVISIQVTGVDIEPILRAAESNDNPGNRRKKIREVLFAELGVTDDGGMFTEHTHEWRGTRRQVEIIYENVREMSDERLHGRSGAWTVVLDFPFDEANRGPLDDLANLANYRGGDTKTMAWLPSFFSHKALADLGRLVVLDHILSGDRFEGHATHLSYVDKVQAKALAKNQLDQLRIKLRSQLEVAFGISTEPRDAVTNPLLADQQFYSLDPTFTPRPPVGANLREAFRALLDQLFAHQYPAHPEFATEIKASAIRKIWVDAQRAIESAGHRCPVPDNNRKLLRAVIPACQLGQVSETHLMIDDHWRARLAQSHARDGGGAMTVAALRRWIDTPNPMGLPAEVQNLIILTFAAQTNRRFVMRGGPFEPDTDSLPDDLELREQALPQAAHWDSAVTRAASLFGLTLAQMLSANNAGRLVDELRREANGRRDAAAKLAQVLRMRSERYAVGAPEQRHRLRTSESALALLAALRNASDADLAQTLAEAVIETSEAALARSMAQAQTVTEAINSTNWDIFDAMQALNDHRAEEARQILQALREALCNDEHVIPLKARLEQLVRDAVRLLTSTIPDAAASASATRAKDDAGMTAVTAVAAVAAVDMVDITPPRRAASAPLVIEQKQHDGLDSVAADALLQSLQERMRKDPTLELSLGWRLTRRSGQS